MSVLTFKLFKILQDHFHTLSPKLLFQLQKKISTNPEVYFHEFTKHKSLNFTKQIFLLSVLI